MREANFKRKGKPVICGECSHIFIYRGKRKGKYAFITCSQCNSSIRLADSLLPTGR